MGPEFQFRFRFQNGRKIPVIKNRSRKIFLAAGVGIIFQPLLNKMPINVSIQSRGRFNETFLKQGGAVAEWSKALLSREKINENQKIPGSPPGLGTFRHYRTKLTPAISEGTFLASQ